MGVDQRGFIPLQRLAWIVRVEGPDVLPEEPALVVETQTDREAPEEHYTVLREESEVSDETDREKFVAFVSKRAGNPFPGLVTVGRSPSCDLVLGSETASKIHAYFRRDEDSWSLVDQCSMNHTFLNGEELPDRARRALSDGDVIRFGGGPEFMWLGAQALRRHLEQASRELPELNA